MEHIRLNTVALLGFAINCAISLGQQASINGVVKDREDKSPIRGAEVKVGAKVLGLQELTGSMLFPIFREGQGRRSPIRSRAMARKPSKSY